jgi:hypothetical protein
MSGKAEPKRTYEAAAFGLQSAGVRPRRSAHTEEAESIAASGGDELVPASAPRRKHPAPSPDMILRLIQILKDL